MSKTVVSIVGFHAANLPTLRIDAATDFVLMGVRYFVDDHEVTLDVYRAVCDTIRLTLIARSTDTQVEMLAEIGGDQ